MASAQDVSEQAQARSLIVGRGAMATFGTIVPLCSDFSATLTQIAPVLTHTEKKVVVQCE